MIKISVIIPIYNVGSYVETAIRSVQLQTLQDFEIICVNDASTDDSADVVREMSLDDSRIRLFELGVNSGAAAARNEGLRHAGGEYVYFLDADDRILPDALEKLYDRACDDDAEVIAFCAGFIYEDPQYEEKFGNEHSVFRRAYPDLLPGRELFILWMESWDWVPGPPFYFYRRDFLEENGIRFHEGMLHEDELFTFDVMMAAKRVRVLNEVLYQRLFRKDSSTTGEVSIRNVEACISILQYVSEYSRRLQDDRLKEAIAIYRSKITETAKRKYAAAGYEGSFFPCGRPPLISVIIPVFMDEDYLPACLDSVLSQDFTDYEVICIDDGSTDGSAAILAEYEKMDPRVRVINSEKNRGQAAARNTGLNAASGEYVYMMDADDLIEPGTFSALHACLVSDAADITAFENSHFTDDPAFEEEAGSVLFSYEGREGRYSGRDAFITLVTEDIISPSVPTYLVRRGLIEDNGIRFREGLPHEDIGFIFEMLVHAASVRLLHNALYKRRFRAHSTVTGGITKERICGYLLSWKKAFDCREYLTGRYGGDEEFMAAWRKWMRDVLGRIRVLYLASEECGASSVATDTMPEEAELMYLMLSETTTGRERAVSMLGSETCASLEKLCEVYVCGTGQYMNRILDAAGALELVVKGIIVPPEEREKRMSIRGFRTCAPEEVTDKETAVVLAVSHYTADRHVLMLEEAGLINIVRVFR